jgi:hypothetical protein
LKSFYFLFLFLKSLFIKGLEFLGENSMENLPKI